jgi:3-dehydroquinate synthase
VLNFGHTIGHAVEAVSGYALLHGEAIAVGMAVEAALGAAAGITRAGTADQLRSALQALDLPTGAGDLPLDAIVDAMTHDKKSRGGTVKFAFLQELGQAARNDVGGWTFSAPEDLVRAALTS